jgi:hypothetical protein
MQCIMSIALVIIIIVIIFLIFTQVQKENDNENFYSSHTYHRRPIYRNRSYLHGYEWYNYPYFWDYWRNPWGYVPCVNDAFGKTRCY